MHKKLQPGISRFTREWKGKSARSVAHKLAFTCALLLCSGALSPAEHHENWIEVKSPHYTIYCNGNEHDGRRVAAQFEEIRALFEQNFPKLKVDFGKPTLVFVLKDENSLKLLMPTYGQNKNAMKLAGFYHPSNDMNFAVVRSDVTGTGANAYHVMYHEWAHGLFRLNFRALPMWLDEGMAEYWGGSDITNKEGHVGMADARQLRILQQGPFLPISTLVSIDSTSPLYNTQDHSGMFYAESWAIVHYFALAPEVRDQHLLEKYLAALHETDDPIEAANRSFGDLKKLGDKLEAYTRQSAFLYQKIPLKSDINEKDFSARRISPAEGLLAQAKYLLRSGHLPEALAALHEAETLDSKTSGLHDGMGYYHFMKADLENAQKEFDLAVAENPADATAYYYMASIHYRKNGYDMETLPVIIGNLEKAIALQPNFAPAHAFLCIAYSKSADQKAKALTEAKTAMELEPGNLGYFIDAGRSLVASGNYPEAKKIADRAVKAAVWPRDRTMANNFAKTVNAKLHPDAANPPEASGAADAAVESGEAPAKATEKEGEITETICGHPPSVMFTLKSGQEQYLLHVKNIGALEMHDGSKTAGGTAGCAGWKDRKAKVEFTPTPDGAAYGEVSAITFE